MNNQMAIFIGILIAEDYNWNFMRIQRKRLRDQMDPFDMPNTAFVQMFRLNKQCVINLINSLQPHIRIINKSISLVTKVLLTLHFLSVGSYQNSIGTSAWLSASQPTVSRSINEICSAIVQELLPIWVKFPTQNEGILNVKQGFFRKYGFRCVMVMVDGTHVEILASPVTDINHPPFVYINRKGKHYLNVMLVTDAHNKIIGCNARFPGSMHDAAVWQVSAIRNHLQIRYQNGDHTSHLLGDSGYPLEPWLFTPFLNPQNQQEEAFNNTLTSAPNVIERTNGILKGRFRCLSRHRTLIYHSMRAPNIIYTCCVLHNMALNAGLNLNEGEIEYPQENDYIDNPAANRNLLQLGREARAAYVRDNY